MTKSVQIYLLGYNFIQLITWGLSLVTTVALLRSQPERGLKFVRIGQTLAWAELAHAMMGIAGGGVAITFVQCLGRYAVLQNLVLGIPFMRTNVISLIMVIAWAIGDIIRYAFYIATILNVSTKNRFYKALKWTRYSAFVVLQPVGILCEWLVYRITLPYVDEQGMYRIQMPNKYNFAFDLGVFNRIVSFSYLYFCPLLISHMLKQRKAKLS